MAEQTCKHYNGVHHNKVCDAGVVYASVQPKPGVLGNFFQLPCKTHRVTDLNDSQRANYAIRGTCDKCVFPTPEEAKKDREEIIRLMNEAADRLDKLEPIIRKIKRENAGKNWSGEVVCPSCGGKLRLTHAKNGHMSGVCETENCHRWME